MLARSSYPDLRDLLQREQIIWDLPSWGLWVRIGVATHKLPT